MEGEFNLVRGDSIALELTFDDGGDPPVPINIAGRTLRFTVKQNYDDPDAEAYVQASVTFPDDADSQAGKGFFFVPHTQTENLPQGQLVVCDFQESYLDSRGHQIVNTLDVFTKKVGPDVTRTV